MIDELRKQFLKYKPNNVERRNGMLIFDLITKYCLFSETLGALINGFESSNQHANPSSTSVLSYLKDYTVKEVKDFFRDLTSEHYTYLTDGHKKKLSYAFGYHMSDNNKTDSEICDIYNILKEIAGVYIFYVDSYNAYKHGHRVWYAYKAMHFCI